MPKLSFAQEMYEMERVVGAARSNAGLLPDFSQDVADQLEALIAEAKAVKAQQQALLAAQMVKTEELAPLIRRGKWAARRLRAYVMLELGTRHAQLTQFGIRLRRRPRRKARVASEADSKERPAGRRSRAIVRAEGAAIPEIGGIDLRLGGEDFGDRAVDSGLGATAAPERGTAAGPRATASAIGGDAQRGRAIVPGLRGTAPDDRITTARAA